MWYGLYNLNVEFRTNYPIIQRTLKINHTLGSYIKTKFILSALNLKDPSGLELQYY